MHKMKILLVNPPIPESYYNREHYLPLNLLYLASSLQKDNNEIRILDFKTFQKESKDPPKQFYGDRLTKTISDFQPDLVGFGCLFSGDFLRILNFSEIIKKEFEELPVITGGIHPTLYPLEILANCPSIDGIVIGEGEESTRRLVEVIKNKSYEFDKIDGIAFRKNGQVIVNPKKSFIENLDDISFPAYNLIDFEDYYVDTSKWHNPKNLEFKTSIPIISSRSCPNRCNFCSMYKVMGLRWRARSPTNVVDEMEYLYNTHGQNRFSFMDDNLTLKRSHILGICNEIIKRKMNIQFETPNGIAIKTLDEEVLDTMVSAGLVRTFLAIESGSDFIRNEVMKKNLSREKIFEVIKLTKKYSQLHVNSFFIIGMPEETLETLEDTYNMIKELDLDRTYVQNIIPFPGTEVFNQALRDNLLVGINPQSLYKSDELYLTNYNRYFIKPYQLELKDLHEFRERCNQLIEELSSKRK